MSQNCDCAPKSGVKVPVNSIRLPGLGLGLDLDLSEVTGNYYTKEEVDRMIAGAGGGIDYSTEEQWTGRRWIDGKKIYQKTVDIGALPNNARKDVPHGIANLERTISVTGCAVWPSSMNYYSLPHNYPDYGVADSIGILCNSTSVIVNTGSDRTNLSGYATIQYTCTDR